MTKEEKQLYDIEYRKKNKESIDKKRLEYRNKTKDKKREYDRVYCQLNVKHKQKLKHDYYIKNKNKISCYYKKWRCNNKEKILRDKQENYLKNRDYIKNQVIEYYNKNKEKIQTTKRKYYNKNKKKIIERTRLWMHKKLATDINFKLASYLRRRICSAIKNGQKGGSAVNDLGCAISSFKSYIENKFQTGMSWDNYGKWHLDHIVPLIKFDLTNRNQFLQACHYTNYQPLWAFQNISKGGR